MNWQKLINSLAHGVGQEAELASQLSDQQAWPTEQLSKLFTEVIPDYHASAQANKEGKDEGQLAAELQRLVRMARAAKAELNTREEAEKEATEAVEDASNELSELTSTNPNDDDSSDDDSSDDDSDDDSDEASDDDSDDDDSDEDLNNQDDDDDDGDDDGDEDEDRDEFSFGEHTSRPPAPTPTPGQMNDQQNDDDVDDDADEDDKDKTDEFGFNIGRLGDGATPLDVYSHDYYSNAESTGMQVVDKGAKYVKGASGDDGAEWSSVEQYAAAIANHHNKSGQQSAARWTPAQSANLRVQEKHQFGFMKTSFGTPLTRTMDFEDQHAIIQGVVQAAQKRPAMVADASGGCSIPPLTPRRDFLRCAVPFAPVRGTLPVINVENEGGMKWMRPPDWRAAKAGIQLTTAAQNAAGYGAPAEIDPETGEEISPSTIPEGGAPFKACMRMPCPTWYEACVDMLSVCVIFDNLQKRVWPGLVQNFLQDVELCVDAILEQYFLTGIDATSEPVVGMQNWYGATRTMLADAKIMRRNLIESEHMGENQVVNWYVPSWALDVICIDLINNNQFGMEFFFNYTVGDIASRLRSQFNINLIPYRDSAVNCIGEPRNQQINQITIDPENGDFCLRNLPRNPITYMHLPGTYAVLDGGDFSTGLYRDSILNKTNDCALFSELWLEIVKLGCTSLVAVHDLCPTGTGAGPIDPFDCAEFPTWISPDALNAESVGQMVMCLPGQEPITYAPTP